jgi:hypothetical protein
MRWFAMVICLKGRQGGAAAPRDGVPMHSHFVSWGPSIFRASAEAATPADATISRADSGKAAGAFLCSAAVPDSGRRSGAWVTFLIPPAPAGAVGLFAAHEAVIWA